MLDKGYRPSSIQSHVAVVKFLRTSVDKVDKAIMVMAGLRKKRHRVVYEEADIISESEAKQAVRWAEEFMRRVEKMISKGHK